MVTKLFNNAVLGIIGFILSTYSVYVEHKVEHKDDSPDGGEYEALCDIEVRVNHQLSANVPLFPLSYLTFHLQTTFLFIK